MTNKEYFEKTFGYDGSIVAKALPNEFGIGSCGYTDCRESCASRHFPRCPLWWTDEQDFDAINVPTADREKVMSWLEGLTDPDWHEFHSDSEVQNIAKSALALLKEDCHNCKLECLLQKYDELKEKYDALLEENASNAEMAEGLKELLKEQEGR